MAFQEHLNNLVDVLTELLESDELQAAVAILATRHPADQADLIEQIDDDLRPRLLAGLPPEMAGAVLEHVLEAQRRQLLSDLPDAVLAPIVDEADEDVAADILQDISPERAEEVLRLVGDREDIDELLVHDEDTAGGMMSTDLITLREDWTAQETIDFLRRGKPDAGQTYYLYAVDADDRLQGVVSLRDLIVADPQATVGEIARRDTITIPAGADRERAAERMRHYNLLALPVIDTEGRLLGVISADDVLDVQVEEATEDIYKMAGVGVKEWAFSPLWDSARRRIPWLAFNMVWAFAGALIIGIFEGTLQKVAALAIFMPMIAGQAGNSGIQTATIVVRSMALGELEPGHAFRVLKKEWVLGLVKGVLFGGVLGIAAWLWRDQPAFGLIAGAAMLLNMMVASTTGVIVPMTLRRFGMDPASIAGVFDTMVTDLMGFLIYLGLATLFISQLT